MSTAHCETLFPLPEPVTKPELSWEDRMDIFMDYAKARGGLLPIPAAADVLGVTRQRVHQLANSNRLELLNYHGVGFISGRSLREYLADDHGATGRNRKKIGVWRAMNIGFKQGFGVGAALNADD